MSEQKNCKIVDEYLNKNNPYKSKSSIGIDLVALTRYAKKCGKRVAELNPKEIKQFKTK